MEGDSASIDFYENIIAPYKGSLEEWFVYNKSIHIYFISIFITLYVVVIPSSKIVWKVFKTLPKPPEKLAKSLNYPI